jgi:hypothetical protein
VTGRACARRTCDVVAFVVLAGAGVAVRGAKCRIFDTRRTGKFITGTDSAGSGSEVAEIAGIRHTAAIGAK